ncbi:MAG: nucleotidyltransferase domain-containing protein [bacterium]
MDVMITQKQIKDFGRRLAREFQPRKVVLFGSYAYGKPSPDSDVDILVVMPLNGNPVDKSVEMRLKLQPRFPLDLLVRTPAKIKERLAMGDDFIKDIFDKGKVLYEAPGR